MAKQILVLISFTWEKDRLADTEEIDIVTTARPLFQNSDKKSCKSKRGPNHK